MRHHNILYLLLLPLLALLASCQQESIRPDDQGGAGDPRTLTFRASVEDATRAAVDEIDGSADLKVTFTPDEQILLIVTQDETSASIYTKVTEVAPDGKSCSFEAELPEEIDVTKPMNIYGYSGIQDGKNWKTNQPEYFLVQDGEVYLDVSPKISMGLSNMRPPIAFVLKDYTATEGKISNLDVLFEHIGAYEVIHVTNKTSNPTLENKVTVQLSQSDAYFHPQTPWMYVHDYSKGYPYLNLSTGEVTLMDGGFKMTGGISSPSIPVGETGVFVNWFVPTPDASYGRVVLSYKDGKDFRGIASETTLSSEEPILTGNAYHVFADIYDDKVVLKDRQGEEITQETPRTVVTTDLPKGSTITLYTYFNFNARNDAFVDLNNNGQKDLGEEIGSAFGDYTKTIDSQTFAIYGKADAIRITGSKITSVRLYGQENLVQLDLRKNELDAAALNQMMKDLPDIHDVEPSTIAPKTLSISQNPGEEEADLDLSIAIDKDWSVDIPLVLEDQPYIYAMMGTKDGIYLNVDAAPEDRDGVWVDLNGNGRQDEGEKITKFGPGAQNMNILENPAQNVIFYGKITMLSAPESGILAVLLSNHDHLTYLDLNGNGLAALQLPGMTNLEFLDVSENGFMLNILPFSTETFTKLKVLNIANSGITEITGGLSQNTELTYLNANGCGLEEIDLSANTKLQSLFLSNNGLASLDVSPLTQLTYLEVIGNKLREEALASLIEGLPTVAGTTPGKLFIAANPGTSGTDIAPAQEKNWKVDTDHLKGDNYIVRPSLPGEEW